MTYSVIYPNWVFISLSIVFGLIIIATAAGNVLVFVALFRFKGLRSTSNLLIGNLALSDFLLAITVLPFSAATDTTGLWLFGSVLCDIWLVIDVLYCTASVWSLVVIAFDRFTATTFPVWYRGKQTKIRVLCYIILVWILSAVICMPGLLGWGYKNMNASDSIILESSNQSLPDSTSTHVYNPYYQGYECVLFTEADYIVYSALGSFIIPLFIMVGLYAKIFAVLRTRSRIYKSTHNKLVYVKSQKSQEEESLDITEERKSSIIKTGTSVETTDQLTQERHIHTSVYLLDLFCHCITCKCVLNDCSDGKLTCSQPESHKKQSKFFDLSSSNSSHVNNDIEHLASTNEIGPNQLNGTVEYSNLTTNTYSIQSQQDFDHSSNIEQVCFSNRSNNNCDQFKPNETNSNSFVLKSQQIVNIANPTILDPHSRLVIGSNTNRRAKKLTMDHTANCRKQNRAAERADQREKRATKRMALIILIFVVCWIPFTLMYLIRGLCGESQCPDIPNLRKFVTWLGYVNSTINPILYAMFNKEFRQAFTFLLGCRKRKRKR